MAASSTTQGKLYFIALGSLERLEVQFVPEELQLSRVPSVQQVEIVGQNLPKLQHQGGERRLSLELDFYASDENREDVITKCLWLESLTYRSGVDTPAERVRLVFGKLFNRDVWMVKSVNYRLKQFDKKYGFLPCQAYVAIELAHDGASEMKASDIKRF